MEHVGESVIKISAYACKSPIRRQYRKWLAAPADAKKWRNLVQNNFIIMNRFECYDTHKYF